MANLDSAVAIVALFMLYPAPRWPSSKELAAAGLALGIVVDRSLAREYGSENYPPR
jgi:hypothetical protein